MRSIRYHPESELQEDENEEAETKKERKKERVKETVKKSKKRERWIMGVGRSVQARKRSKQRDFRKSSCTSAIASCKSD